MSAGPPADPGRESGGPAPDPPRREDPPPAPRLVAAGGLGRALAEASAARLPGVDRGTAELGITLAQVGLAHVEASERGIHRPAGLSWAGFRILYLLWALGPAEARHLARLAGVSRQATSTVLARLEDRGLVTRERAEAQDRRLLRVELTPAGAALATDVVGRQHELDARWSAALTEDERGGLLAVLTRVLHALEDRD